MPRRTVPKTAKVPTKPHQIDTQAKAQVNAPVSKKPPVIAPETNILDTDTGAAQQFEVELCWCIQQLQTALLTRHSKMDSKQSNDVLRSLNVLKNNNAPLIKKRQLMRSTFGDYRAKMAEEEKKYKRDKPNIKFDASSPSKKSRFLKHSTFSSKVLKLARSDNSFRFNFDNPPVANDGAISTTDCENKNKEGDQSPEADIKVPVPVENVGNNSQSKTSACPTSSSFKFHSSNNSFRFNFAVEETVKEGPS